MFKSENVVLSAHHTGQISRSVMVKDPTRPLSLKLDDSGLYWTNNTCGPKYTDRCWNYITHGRFENHMKWCNEDKSKMLQAYIEDGRMVRYLIRIFVSTNKICYVRFGANLQKTKILPATARSLRLYIFSPRRQDVSIDLKATA